MPDNQRRLAQGKTLAQTFEELAAEELEMADIKAIKNVKRGKKTLELIPGSLERRRARQRSGRLKRREVK